MAELEQDIADLERLLRSLEKEYELFFAGQRRSEPSDVEAKIQAIIRTWSRGAIQNNTLAFRLNTVMARYNSLKTVWSRRVREREEGRGAPGPARVASRQARAAAGRPAPRPAAGREAQYVAVDPAHEPRRMQRLYETYRTLREQQGESVERLRAEGFQKTLSDRVAKIKAQYGCDAVLIRVVADGGRTRIVARPYRRGADGGGE